MIKSKLFKIISIALFIIISVYVFLFGIKKATDYEIYKEKEIKTKIYTIWHVETFEGGSKPRIQYLKNIARDIEKENDGVLFMISAVLPEDLETKLKSSTPDIISFGFGVGKVVLPYLIELDSEYNVRDNLIESSKHGKALMAIPYISSGYAKITDAGEVKNFYIGNSDFVFPFKHSNNVNNLQTCKTQYEAYKSFVNSKNTGLIGTARDVYRVLNLNNIGRMNALIEPLTGYSDLIQYCGITNKDEIILSFVENLLDDKYQQTLTTYSLFGVKINKLYSSNIYNDMENAIFNAQIPNVFDEKRV